MLTQQVVYNAYLGALSAGAVLVVFRRFPELLNGNRRRSDRRSGDRRGPDRRREARPRCFERRFDYRRNDERRTDERRGVSEAFARAA